VGSAINLTNRLSNYFSPVFLKRSVLKGKSLINNSLLKYGYCNFSLDIIEYCESSILIKREQYYIDTLNPEYNILKRAGSSLGYKHTKETLLKFKERKLSPGHITTVVNKKDNTVKIYNFIHAVSRDIGINHATIRNYINTNK
jgi:group I intron endonuclease